MAYSPVVAFRGTRTYVHSTTIYEQLIKGALQSGLKIEGPIDMRMNQLIRKQPRFLFTEGSTPRDYAHPAYVSFHIGETCWHCTISERDECVERREAYDETQVSKKAVVDGQAIRVDGKVNARPFEIVTSLTLQLHNALYSIPSDRKWFLARVQLERLLSEEDAAKLQIVMTKKSGAGLTRSVIVSGPAAIGTIHFMLGNLA